MAGYKETPRQKMIAMMYLVLTALLALNVSVEIINAFVVVNKSIEGTNENLKSKNLETYARFEQQYQLNEAKVGPYWERAQEVRKISDEMIAYIDNVKWDVISRAEGITIDQAKITPLGDIQAKDKYDVTTNYFIGNSPNGSKGRAAELRKKIELFKASILSAVEDPQAKANIKVGLDTEGPYTDASGDPQNWEMHNFYHTILAANVTFLNKLIADVRNVESDVVSVLFNSISAEDFKFDQLAARVIPNSRMVFSGDQFEAEIMVAAIDTKQNPNVVVNGRTLPAENGVAKYTVAAGATGLQTYKGEIRVVDPTGETKTYPFEGDYFVMTPSLSVAPTKMNVFYANVDNPVTISASGIPESQIAASITSGTIRKEGKEWVVRVPSGVSKATVSVSHNDKGKIRNMGKADFRVKRVPSPTAYIGGTDGGPLAKNMLLASKAIIPKMPDDFDFNLTFEITSFTFVGTRGGDIFEKSANSNRLTPEMITFIENSKKGQRIWFENIMAKGPDGNRKLGTIGVIVQ